jgi:hypothetical protein
MNWKWKKRFSIPEKGKYSWSVEVDICGTTNSLDDYYASAISTMTTETTTFRIGGDSGVWKDFISTQRSSRTDVGDLADRVLGYDMTYVPRKC